MDSAVFASACSENASPGLFIVGFVKDGLAELDGRLQKDDRILQIEGHDLANGTQEEAANIIRVRERCVRSSDLFRPYWPVYSEALMLVDRVGENLRGRHV